MCLLQNKGTFQNIFSWTRAFVFYVWHKFGWNYSDSISFLSITTYIHSYADIQFVKTTFLHTGDFKMNISTKITKHVLLSLYASHVIVMGKSKSFAMTIIFPWCQEVEQWYSRPRPTIVTDFLTCLTGTFLIKNTFHRGSHTRYEKSTVWVVLSFKDNKMVLIRGLQKNGSLLKSTEFISLTVCHFGQGWLLNLKIATFFRLPSC